MKFVSIGDILVAEGLITTGQLLDLQSYCQAHPDITLEQAILQRDLCSPEALRDCVSRHDEFGTTHLDPEECISLLERNTERLTQRTDSLQTLSASIWDDR